MSRSAGKFVSICEGFQLERGQRMRQGAIHTHVSAIFSGCEPRFKTTMTTFAFFFLEVYNIIIHYTW